MLPHVEADPAPILALAHIQIGCLLAQRFCEEVLDLHRWLPGTQVVCQGLVVEPVHGPAVLDPFHEERAGMIQQPFHVAVG